LAGDTLSIVFTGDILLDRGVRRVINQHGVDHLFSDGIDSVFRSAQLVVGNLECPATKIDAPVFKRFIFRGEPEWLDTLRQHGITHLNLANNHSIDQGREGLLDTRRNIVEAGMVPMGAGENMQEASEPVLLASRPRNVWFVPSLRLALENYAYLPDKPCVSQEPMDSLIRRVYRLREADSTAVIIVSLHWGGEHTLKPVPRQRLEAHQLILAGADALICHHTHTLQTIETFMGKPIYYSIGNFIFDPTKPLNAKACIVRLEVTQDSVQAETIPVEIRNCTPYLAK
jgi:poly-gamma-glutamate synthesis protein (capsule biosynthesis protein)